MKYTKIKKVFIDADSNFESDAIIYGVIDLNMFLSLVLFLVLS